MPCHEFDARFKFVNDAVNPGGQHNAVGVGEAKNIAIADIDEF